MKREAEETAKEFDDSIRLRATVENTNKRLRVIVENTDRRLRVATKNTNRLPVPVVNTRPGIT